MSDKMDKLSAELRKWLAERPEQMHTLTSANLTALLDEREANKARMRQMAETLGELSECAKAIVGVDAQNDDASEAFDMFFEAQTKAYRIIAAYHEQEGK